MRHLLDKTGTGEAHSFFSPRTQFDNVGDALINREMMRLAATCSHVHLNLTRCPTAFAETMGVGSLGQTYNSYLDLFWSMIRLSIMGHRCTYFLSPGGYKGELAWKEIPSRILNTFVLGILRLFGVRICLIGLSYEKMGPKFLLLQRLRIRLFFRHIVRDKKSFRYAQANGLPVHGIMPDLAFNIFDGEPRPCPTQMPRRVALCFRTDQYPEQEAHIQQTVLHLIDALPPETDYILVVQVERDMGGMDRLKNVLDKRLGKSTPLFIRYQDIEDGLKTYATCDLIVSNRLHSLLMGSSQMGRMIPVVRNGWNTKIDAILDDLDLTKLAVTAGETSSADMRNAVQKSMQTPVYGNVEKQKLQKVISDILSAE